MKVDPPSSSFQLIYPKIGAPFHSLRLKNPLTIHASRMNVFLSKMSKHWELRSLQEILRITKKGQKPPYEM